MSRYENSVIFRERLEKVSNESFSREFVGKVLDICGSRVPNERIIKAVLAEWEIWKPYVTEDSLERFVLHELESMHSIRATATSSSPNLRSYIGNKATIAESLCSVLATAITENGTLLKDGREVIIK